MLDLLVLQEYQFGNMIFYFWILCGKEVNSMATLAIIRTDHCGNHLEILWPQNIVSMSQAPQDWSLELPTLVPTVSSYNPIYYNMVRVKKMIVSHKHSLN